MNISSAVNATNIRKKYKGFLLDIPQCRIPKGFATALIGENGAGKTTFLNLLAGIRLDFSGEVTYFEESEKNVDEVKERIGYTGPGAFFLPNWTLKQVEEVSKLLFENFHLEKYRSYCEELKIGTGGAGKKISGLSDGNRMKLMLAAVLARDTELLLLDEPASPLDPLMRDKLCQLIQDYIAEENGERSVLFSTHNIADMESVTDYCIIMEHGKIVEQGFVEDLKEKYLLIKGEPKDAEAARRILYSFSGNSYGYEGICLAKDVDQLAGMDIHMETPNLSQISIAVMKAHTNLSTNQV